MTPSRETTSTGETYQRAQACGLPAEQMDGNDLEAMLAAIEEAAARARRGQGPTYIEAMTYRLVEAILQLRAEATGRSSYLGQKILHVEYAG